MRSDIEGLVNAADPASGTSFYYELDDTFYSVTSKTFIGQLFELLGLENIADAVGEGSGGYPQLSAEYIIESDPDLIFLADTEVLRPVARDGGRAAGLGRARGGDRGRRRAAGRRRRLALGAKGRRSLRQIAEAADSAEANAA